MINPVIKQILNTAVYAPSGDNSQPWKFEAANLSIKQFNIPDRDNPIFNFKQRGSYIAHGAVLQNIILLSENLGYETKINFFPDKENLNLVAEINLIQKNTAARNESLIDLIKKRQTNRKTFKNRALSPEQKKSLNLINDGGHKILFTEDKNKIKLLANAASAAERVMLEYKPLHDDFFKLLRWTKKEEEEKRFGMLVDTLELLPPQKLIFKWFSNWSASAFLRKINLPKFISKENSKIYASAPIIGAILIEDNSPENYVKTGMLFQKVWLKTTELGLSLQPIAGVLYLAQHAQESKLPDLDPVLEKLIFGSSKTIYQSLENPKGILSMMFRIGFAEQPSAHSFKSQPEIKEK